MNRKTMFMTAFCVLCILVTMVIVIQNAGRSKVEASPSASASLSPPPAASAPAPAASPTPGTGACPAVKTDSFSAAVLQFTEIGYMPDPQAQAAALPAVATPEYVTANPPALSKWGQTGLSIRLLKDCSVPTWVSNADDTIRTVTVIPVIETSRGGEVVNAHFKDAPQTTTWAQIAPGIWKIQVIEMR